MQSSSGERDHRRGPGRAALVVGAAIATAIAGVLLAACLAWSDTPWRAVPVAGIGVLWLMCLVRLARGAAATGARPADDSRWAMLNERNRQLEELNRTKNEVLTSASHELRQPVHALGLLVERLRVDPDAAAFRPTVDALASIIDTLSEALGSLLNIARLDSGSITPHRHVFELKTLFDKLRDDFEPAFASKGLRFVVDVPTGVWLHTDDTLLHSIVSNFVSNALRYTERGSVAIAYRTDEHGQSWIDVTDTGRGVPESMKEKIFREYVRLEVEGQAIQGFGLGLAIVKRTCTLLGLALSVDSELGRGSRFSVGVPVVNAPDHPSPAPTRNALQPIGSASMVGLNALIVDNDSVVLSGMESMLRAWGCRVVMARSVADLRAKLAHVRVDDFDFMIADFHLGSNEPNGMDAIRLVRSLLTKHLPIAVLTGDVNVRSDNLANGESVLVLHKPLLPSRLKKAIEAMAANVGGSRASA